MFPSIHVVACHSVPEGSPRRSPKLKGSEIVSCAPPTAWPRSVMKFARLRLPPSVPRLAMYPVFQTVATNAGAPVIGSINPLLEIPVMVPRELIATARLKSSPSGSVPKSVATPFCHRTAWFT